MTKEQELRVSLSWALALIKQLTARRYAQVSWVKTLREIGCPHCGAHNPPEPHKEGCRLVIAENLLPDKSEGEIPWILTLPDVSDAQKAILAAYPSSSQLEGRQVFYAQWGERWSIDVPNNTIAPLCQWLKDVVEQRWTDSARDKKQASTLRRGAKILIEKIRPYDTSPILESIAEEGDPTL